MPWATDGRWISEREKQEERKTRKAIPTDTYRHPFVLVGPPGAIKGERYIYGKGGVPVRQKTLVVLDCGHGKIHLDTAVQQGDLDREQLKEVRAIYGPLEYGIQVATKDVHPLIDLSEEDQAKMVAEGKQLPRPLRSMTCPTCLEYAIKDKQERERLAYEEKRADWIKSGQKAALDAYVEKAQAQQTFWEELDMAVYDELEGRVADAVTEALAKIGIDSSCLDFFIDDEGGLNHPSESEEIPTPLGSTYVSRYSEEDLAGLGRTATFSSVTIKLDKDAMAKVMMVLGIELDGLSAAMSKDEVLAGAETLLTAKRAAKEAKNDK